MRHRSWFELQMAEAAQDPAECVRFGMPAGLHPDHLINGCDITQISGAPAIMMFSALKAATVTVPPDLSVTICNPAAVP